MSVALEVLDTARDWRGIVVVAYVVPVPKELLRRYLSRRGLGEFARLRWRYGLVDDLGETRSQGYSRFRFLASRRALRSLAGISRIDTSGARLVGPVGQDLGEVREVRIDPPNPA